ncbi:MAG TPA: ACP S-malonyltransferase [Acidimicrobiales bacterium]|jgi:[acyl-carrier-protein] S-malonyltransferase|nr:ACP S-malonyltransferase [Acidimicrobiales bacterium]
MPSDAPPLAPTALGFPGQGGDWRSAIRTLAAHPTDEAVQAVAAVLGTDRWDELDERDTRIAQPVIVAAGLAASASLDRTAFGATVGHSLGEITASAAAGALTPTQAVELAALRAQLGHRCHDARPGAMAAIMKLRVDQVEWLRRTVLADHDGILEIAVANSPTQHVLSGDRALLEAAATAAEQTGGVVRHLPIGGAFHSPRMAPAVAELTAAAADVLRDPACPVVLSTWAEPVRAADVLAERLGRSLVLPVEWSATLGTLVGLGIDQLVDAGPGDTLVRLARHLPGPATRVIEAP